MRVGLVEDQAEIVEVMTLLLKLEGHEVVAHKSGEVLLEALAAGEIYDVLLLDLGLPDGRSRSRSRASAQCKNGAASAADRDGC